MFSKSQSALAHLGGFLHELGVVLLDVVPGPDGGLQFVSHHHARTLRRWATDERHDASARVRKGALWVK